MSSFSLGDSVHEFDESSLPPPAPSLNDSRSIQPLIHTNGLVSWSPCGSYVAIAKDTRVSIRDSNMSLVQVFTCADMVQSIQWSPNDLFILCAMFKRAMVQVYAVLDPSWSCKIAEGVAGMICAKWAPDSRHIFTISDFRIHITVWSLVDTSKFVIRNPKLSSEGVTFSPDKSYVAIAERVDCKDAIGIYSMESWELGSRFDVASYDLVEISWSPDGRVICVRDTHLEYRILFYSIQGELIHRYEPYINALGIKSIAWSNSGQLLAVGSYDEKLRIISNCNWKSIAELDHVQSVVGVNTANKNTIVHKELAKDNVGQYQATTTPINVVTVTPDAMKDAPRLGVGVIQWSSNSKYIATRNDAMPNYIFIWESDTMVLYSIIAFESPVKTFRWSPKLPILAISTSGNHVSFWHEKSKMTSNQLTTPDDQTILGIRWHPLGVSVLALTRQELVCIQVDTRE